MIDSQHMLFDDDGEEIAVVDHTEEVWVDEGGSLDVPPDPPARKVVPIATGIVSTEDSKPV